MVFCVFNWHDELLRAQMDDWTANIESMYNVFACYLSMERLPLAFMYLSPKEPKKRDFDKGQPLTLPDEPKKSQKVDSCRPKNKTKTTQKHIKTREI